MRPWHALEFAHGPAHDHPARQHLRLGRLLAKLLEINFYHFNDMIPGSDSFRQYFGSENHEFDKTVALLQSSLAEIDRMTAGSSHGSGTFEFLVLRMSRLKIKMYKEKRHKRPHVHIDYGTENHAASYAIDTAKRLKGNLPRKYEITITKWIETNRMSLDKLWTAAQTGEPVEELVIAIRSACEL